MSLAILVDGQRVERAREVDERVVRRERFELVARADEREASDLREFVRDRVAEAGGGVEAGADCGAALREDDHAVADRGLDTMAAAVELVRIAGEFLPERQRRRVLEVGTADLDDVVPGVGLAVECGVELVERGDQAVGRGDGGGDVQGGREAVVGRLAHVDVVVGMDRGLAAAGAGEDLVGAAGDDLVRVHVRLRAAAGLPDDEGELVVELAVDDFLRGGVDGGGDGFVEAVRPVYAGGGLFDEG
jgi:hypothetical protein